MTDKKKQVCFEIRDSMKIGTISAALLLVSFMLAAGVDGSEGFFQFWRGALSLITGVCSIIAAIITGIVFCDGR